jgi:hypothetical protein
MGIHCTYLMDIHGISKNIQGYTMYIQSDGYTWYNQGFSRHIPGIWGRTTYAWYIPGIFQAYTENRGSRCSLATPASLSPTQEPLLLSSLLPGTSLFNRETTQAQLATPKLLSLNPGKVWHFMLSSVSGCPILIDVLLLGYLCQSIDPLDVAICCIKCHNQIYNSI